MKCKKEKGGAGKGREGKGEEGKKKGQGWGDICYESEHDRFYISGHEDCRRAIQEYLKFSSQCGIEKRIAVWNRWL